MQQGVSLQAMSIDCLNTSKHFTIIDCINTLESANSQVRQAFSRLTQEHQSMADDWFRLMERRGWYQVPEARPEIRTQMANFVNTMQTSMRSMPGQSYTSAAQPSYGFGHQTFGSQSGYGQGGFGSQIYGQQSAAQYQSSPMSGMSGTSFGSSQYL
jgi:hypothetical protein